MKLGGGGRHRDGGGKGRADQCGAAAGGGDGQVERRRRTRRAGEVEDSGERRAVGDEPGDAGRRDEVGLRPSEHRRAAGAAGRHAVPVGGADGDDLGQPGHTEDRLRPRPEVAGRGDDGDSRLAERGDALPELRPAVGQAGRHTLGRRRLGQPGRHRVEQAGGREGEDDGVELLGVIAGPGESVGHRRAVHPALAVDVDGGHMGLGGHLEHHRGGVGTEADGVLSARQGQPVVVALAEDGLVRARGDDQEADLSGHAEPAQQGRLQQLGRPQGFSEEPAQRQPDPSGFRCRLGTVGPGARHRGQEQPGAEDGEEPPPAARSAAGRRHRAPPAGRDCQGELTDPRCGGGVSSTTG
jgi:hypothetical protein